LVRAGYRKAAGHAAAIVCVSDDVASDVRSATRSARRAPQVVTIPNAVDTDLFRPPDQARRAALRAAILPADWQERPVAVLASRLHPAKGHDRAVALAAALDLPLVVVGEGPDRERLERLASNGRAIFLGRRDDVPDILAACDVYLFAGATAEGTPFALLEAAATGLLLVGFTGDEGARTVTGCGGVLVETSDEVPPELVSLVARPDGRGTQARDFVLAHHDRRGWLSAHAELIRGIAR
jgi:glycosyltransferase involved in cell wall biosynthesis